MSPLPIAKIATQFNEIRKRSWIFERVRAVGVEETAAVGAELLDDFLRSDRALRDGLVGHGVHDRLALRVHHRLAVWLGLLDLHRFDQFRRVIGLEVLNDSLRNQHQSSNDAERQQNPHVQRTRSTQKLPRVCIWRRAIPRMNAIASTIPTAAEMKL